jgi:hypothetical protein
LNAVIRGRREVLEAVEEDLRFFEAMAFRN